MQKNITSADLTTGWTKYWLETKQMLILALPIILGQVAQNSMNFVDIVMVGRGLGGTALASTSLAGALYILMFVSASGIITAVSPMVSQAYGAGKTDMVGKATRQGLVVAAILAVPVWVTLQNSVLILSRMGQETVVVELAGGYLKAISWAILPYFFLFVLRNMMRGISRPLPLTIITLLGIPINIFLNYMLMFGKFGMPALGVVGTGWASTGVAYFMIVLAIFYIHSSCPEYHVFDGFKGLEPNIIKQIFKIGIPISMSLLAELSMFSLSTIIIGRFGKDMQAAHSVALQTITLVFMVPIGISAATDVRVGQAWGRGEFRSAQLSGYVGIFLTVFVMCCSAFCFWQFPRAIVSIFLDFNKPDNQPIIPFAVAFLGFAAIFQLFDGLQVTIAGALRGMKDTAVPMGISLFAYWVVGVPFGLFLAFNMALQGRGIWIGLMAGLMVAGVLLLRRFRLLTKHHLKKVDE